MPPSSGVRFGRYRLIEQIGMGGMGIVHRAIIDGPRGFARDVVIKRLLPELSRDAGFVDMLATEAQLCARLRHPGIVHVHEFGEINGEFYLSMELVEGDSLLTILKELHHAQKYLPTGVACFIIAELAAALAYAHALTNDAGEPLQIVHRDVTPSNVMLTRAGGVKLLDFGIAKAATQIGKEHTLSGTLRGKLSYMSPEQAEGLRIDRRSDIFALGVIFWECLTLKRLFKGETDFETLRLIRQPKVAPPSTLVPGLDPELDAVVLKMLAPDIEQRYASCEEIATALAPIVYRHHGDSSAVRKLVAELPPRPRAKPVRVLAALPSGDTTSATPLAADRRAAAADGGLGDEAATRADNGPASARATKRGRRWLVVAVGMAGAVGLAAQVGQTLRTRHPAAPLPRAPTATAPTSPTTSVAPTAATAATAVNAPTAVNAATAADATAPQAAALPAMVRLRLQGPSGAEVLVDRLVVGQLPLDVRLPRAEGVRQLQIRRRGFAPWTRLVTAHDDVSLDVALHRQARQPSPLPVKSPATGPRIRDPFQPLKSSSGSTTSRRSG
jgi:hypothetical protein